MALTVWPKLHTVCRLPKLIKHIITVTCILVMSATAIAADGQRRAMWYRYYDQKGIANLSSSVTPNHIRFGYEALDQNLQVIYKNRPYSADADNRESHERQVQSIEEQYDLRLRRAYGSSKTATLKRDQQLVSINRQLNFQQQQLRTLMNEKVNYKRQELDYLRKGANVPPSLQQRLQQNDQEITGVRKTIENLQIKLRDTSAQYDRIISRLKALES